MKKLLVFALLGALGFGAWVALQPQMRYAQTVNELSRRGPYLVTIEGDYAAMLARAAREGKRAFEIPPPVFRYVTVQNEGRAMVVRPLYTEKEAPRGGVMSMEIAAFLASSAADPKAEGIALNPGVENAPYAVVVPKDQVLRMVDSLKRRGY